jgi:hypothetical protein
VPEPRSSVDNVFMFQQVAVTREKVIKGKDWIKIASLQRDEVFTMSDKDDQDLKWLANLYSGMDETDAAALS